MVKWLKKALLGVVVFVPVYLLLVFFWANAVVDELLAQGPYRGQATLLQPRHVNVLLRIEDPTFHEHRGWDLSNGQGVTTITSILARDLFLGGHAAGGIQGAMQSFYRGVFNCCKRIDLGRDVMSLVLDAHTTKQQQLDAYVKTAYFGSLDGRGVIGFEAAARAYCGKELSQVTDKEFYGLMAMPIAPNRYHPVRHPEVHAERAKRIAALAAGKCEPSGWLDLTYDDCADFE